jgi:hypothetical protein
VSESGRRRLVISEDDLAAAPNAVPAAPAAPPRPSPTPSSAPPAFPPVEGAGTPARRIDPRPAIGASPIQPVTPFLRTVPGRNLAAAVVGIVVGWGVAEITVVSTWTPTTETSSDLFAGTWVAVLGLFFAVIYVGWEHVVAQNWEGVRLVARRVWFWGAALGFGAGVAGQVVYVHFVKQILSQTTLSELVHISSNYKLYLTRALAWGLFGLVMGLVTAIGTGSRDKLINGLIGGAVGGALGGFVFNWAAFNVSSGALARLIGVLVVGAGIGLAIGVVEKARREAWLHVSGGAMTGKEFILYGTECNVGSSPKCTITLIKDPLIQPFHFVIQSADGASSRSRVLSAFDGCPVTVNGQPVARHQLRSGDTIGVGATALSYSERAIVA